MRREKPLPVVCEGLGRITLPPLSRPRLGPKDNPTEELVSWGINYYVYSAIAHVRTVLQGLVMLVDGGNVPTTFLVSRNVFEWAAHTCYASRNLSNYVSRKEWARAWKLLSAVATGNLWVKQHGLKYEPKAILNNVPDPLSISNVIAADDEYQRQHFGLGDAKDSYGLLSEYSHPNSTCIQQYHQIAGQDVRFITPTSGSPLPVVNWCLIDFLLFLDQLLELSNEKPVRSQLVAVLKEVAKLAPAKRHKA
jgi:hypothetical protein